MTKMYVANFTKQVHSFIYRLPGTKNARQQAIEIGQQVRLSGELTQIDVDSVIEQKAPYGFIRADEVGKMRKFVGLCYSIDKPVPMDAIRRGIEQNMKALEVVGANNRKEAALAVASQVEENAPGSLKALEMTVEEDAKGELGDDFGEQTVRVDTEAPGEQTSTRPEASARRNKNKK